METAIRLSSQSTGSSSSLRLSEQQADLVKQLMAMPVKKKEELFNSYAPTMRQVDNMSLVFYLSYCIGDYLAFIGLDSAMTEKQTNDTAMILAETHPNLQVDAIKLFFNNCKRGIYGKHYNRMDGSVILQWFDAFCDDFFVQREEADYQQHLTYKEDIAAPAKLSDEDGEPIDIQELIASFHGKSKEQMEREKQIADLRKDVQNKYMHLFNEMSVDEADKIIEKAIIEEMKAQGLLTF